MKKVAIIICAHCHPDILKLTLGTWLEKYKGDYEAKVYITLHGNYSHYCDKMSEITSMQNVEFIFVDEIRWNSEEIFRYSRMHAKCMMAAFEKIKEYDFTHVAILDHDLVFKEDFVGWCLEEHSEHDMICGLMNDRDGELDLKNEGRVSRFAPKPTVWHVVLSRKIMDRIMSNMDIVMPGTFGGITYDTFARVYESVLHDVGISMGLVPCADLKNIVVHLCSLSFNFGVFEEHTKMLKDMGNGEGSWGESHRAYNKRVDKIRAEYNDKFPNGIDDLLKKLK